ncbi:hypothetical protein Hanom_Chr12g01159521 [Helianthus anomalus]
MWKYPSIELKTFVLGAISNEIKCYAPWCKFVIMLHNRVNKRRPNSRIHARWYNLVAHKKNSSNDDS